MMGAIELQTIGLQHVPESTSGFLISLFVVLTPVVGWLALRHHLRAGVWAGVALATLGVGVIAWHGLTLRPGVAVTLLSALVWSLHLLANSAFSTPERALRLAVVQIVVAAAAACALAVPGGVGLPSGTHAWLAMAYLAGPATVVCYLLQTWAQGAVPAAQAAVLLTCEPVFVAAFAALSGHTPTGRELVGGALVVAAMLVIETPAVRMWRRPVWTRRRARPDGSRRRRRTSPALGRLMSRRRPASPPPPGRPRRRRKKQPTRVRDTR
jgi:drug/metabolite transporter (DMT)-like permease